MAIEYRGEKFTGYNKPKPAPQSSPKKYVVLAKSGAEVKKVSFGAKGYSDFLQHKDKDRRANFKARHNCSEKNNKLKAGYWACNYNW